MNVNQVNKKLKAFPSIPDAGLVTSISLQNNQITSIPPEIGNFIAASTLHLHNNQIQKLPPQIGNLPKLQQLFLLHNKLRELPAEIGNLKSLTSLRIDHNELIGLPDTLGGLSNLNQLNASTNQISNIPSSFGSLIRLKHLDLGFNNISEIEEGIFGNLSILTILNLSNNNLSRIPEDFIKLIKLTKLNLDGNNLPLPTNVAGMKPIDVIKHILKNQPAPSPEMNTNRFSIFRNISQSEDIVEEFVDNLNDKFLEAKLAHNEITKLTDLKADTNICFITVAYDVHQNENLLFNLVNRAKELEVKLFILMQGSKKDAGGLINLSKGPQIETMRAKLEREFSDNIIKFKDIEDLHNKIIAGLKQYTPKIRIEKLELENIGHFAKVKILFNDQINCLIGENGTGKSTILRSIALALVGAKSKDVKLRKIHELLKIDGVDDDGDSIINKTGKISLYYSIDGESKRNIINFAFENGTVEVYESGDFDIISKSYNLKSLIVGFPQMRGESSEKTNLVSRAPQANIADLVPLINSTGDDRLSEFSEWILMQFGEANKKVARSKKINLVDTEEYRLIEKVFNVISKLTERKIAFLDVSYNQSPAQIIVSTYDSKKGIPLDLISQGFKVVLGWVGYYLQRLVEAYPMSKADFNHENSILLVDEVDTFIHPRWQSEFINNLKEIFTKTQFIVSTHSPLVVAGLEPNNIIDLVYNRGRIIVNPSELDIKYLDVGSILLGYFGLKSVVNTKLQLSIEKYNKLRLKSKLSEKELIDLNETEFEIEKSNVGRSVHDFRYMSFLAFLNKHGISSRDKIENLKLSKEQEKELLETLNVELD